jgi:2-polyprenyl-6-hydroxyphenyl methylase/3-demethylubiquinone-9 3-methyltransferase
MSIDFEGAGFSEYEMSLIKKCISMLPDGKLDQRKIWYLLDKIWESCECNNKKVSRGNIARFYSHPVWLMNGLFIENDEISMRMRRLISDWIVQNAQCLSIHRIVDYGGGFGTLARLIAEKNGDLKVDILEPYPAVSAKKRLILYPNVSFFTALDANYDALLCIDVLEHVPDPLWNLSEMIASVRSEGHLLFGNNFTPVVKCHLPATFHLRYMFNRFATLMGIKFLGTLQDTHVAIYKKTSDTTFDWPKIRLMEKISKFFFPFLRILHLCHRHLSKQHHQSPYVQGFMFWDKIKEIHLKCQGRVR